MGRFYGDHPGTRQARGMRGAKPPSHLELLAAMERELQRRINAFGPSHPYTEMERQAIFHEKRREHQSGD